MEQLLKLLENNARLPLEDIAAMLDKPVEEVAALMDEATAKGYIKGYKTLVDWEKVGADRVSCTSPPKRAAALTRSPPPSPPSTRSRACF